MGKVVSVTGDTQLVIVKETAPPSVIEVVARGPQGPVGDVNPLMIALNDQAQASANAAASSESNAATSAAASLASSNLASIKATEAATSADDASVSAIAANASMMGSAASETAALASKNAAAASATAAADSATTASTKANEAGMSATAAAASASSASSSASTATTKAGEASTSATSAAASASAAATSASTAFTKATEASNSASFADVRAGDALAQANAASASASTATTKAGEASASATDAATSAGVASSQASNAGASAATALQAKADTLAALNTKLDVLAPEFAGNAATASKLKNVRTLTASGDLNWSVGFDGSGDVSAVATLSNSGATAGTYNNSATTVRPFTVDAKGRITGIGAAVTITPAWESVTGKPTTLAGYGISDAVASSKLGAANGVATLDASGLVPTSQLPSYVDDVLEFASLAGFPVTGEAGKIYVDLTTNKTYRWSGTAYVYITSGAVDSVAGKTGVVVLVKADVGLGSVDNTPDANKPVSTAQQAALNLKANLASPAFTGVPVVPTADAGTNTTQAASTAYVLANSVQKDTNTGAAQLPVGTVGQRPANGKGKLRFNEDTGRFEGNNGTAWGSLGGATGGGNDDAFYENTNTITSDYAITAGKNAMSAGPITVADGATITIPDGSVWTIV